MQIEEEDGVNEETEKYRSEFENLYFENAKNVINCLQTAADSYKLA
jgi:hypothetical protein